MRSRGIGLMEILIGTALVGGLVILVGTIFRQTMRGERTAFTQQAVESDLMGAVDHLWRVGRSALACRKDTTLNPPSFECDVTPRNGAAKVRFVLRDVGADGHRGAPHQHFEYEEGVVAGGLTTWAVRQSYGNVTSFAICSDAAGVDMRGPATDPCLNDALWKPTKISSEYAARYNTPQSRFFRIRLTGGTADGSAPSLDRTVQTSLFVRNPIGIANLAYK